MKTILVIEDDSLIRHYLVEILNFHHFRTLESDNGSIGLDLVRDVQPDLILCDVHMPGLDGYDVLQAVRKDPRLLAIPFIFLTARASHTEVRKGMNLGADDYLIKPCSSYDLLAAIESGLTKRENLNQFYSQQVEAVKGQLREINHWDPLTQLPNRLRFQEKLKTLCTPHRLEVGTQSLTHFHRSIATLVIKVSNYRNVCLTQGQEIGQAFLKAIAERLKKATTSGLTARLSDEVFGVILKEAGTYSSVNEFTQMLLGILNMPYTIEGIEIQIQCHIGISLFPHHDQNPENLILQAEMAMRWCREQSRKGYRFYNPSIATRETERQLLIADLSKAIERSDLELHYQPQINLVTGKLDGVEALVRWNHTERGLINPGSFIQVAEESGLIIPLGEWVLRSACQQNMAWSEHLKTSMSVSVNLSMQHFADPALPQLITEILEDTCMDPNCLVLELTESCLMQEVEGTIARLKQLKKMGIKLAIDDFGTGYSSLSYLSQLPIDELKIDQSFVQQLNRDRNSTVISSTIISMAKSMGLKVVAEGIEDQQQNEFLRKAGCHLGQGFFYSKPINSGEMIKWFQNPSILAIEPIVPSNHY